MIGGSAIGSENIGSFNIDNFVYVSGSPGLGIASAEPSLSYSFELSGAGLGSAGTDLTWAVLTFNVPAGIGLGGSDIQSQVNGSISVDADVAGLGLGSPELSQDIILRGTPDFFVTRSGTTVTITVSNREEREIRLFRSDDHNTGFSAITVFTADSYVDTVPSATKNYKYKLAFTVSVTPVINGLRSISKFTKT